jgi:hypothetical protein
MPHVEQLSANGVLRHEWRQLGRLALESLATGVFVSLVLALAVFIVSSEVHAANGDISQGTLLLHDETGAKPAAPMLSTVLPGGI